MNEVVSYEYADVRKAIYNFLKQYIQPAIDSKTIIWGNQNNISLPAGTNDYCIFYIQNVVRHGTNTSTYDPDEEQITLKECSEILVRVDCYADTSNGTSGIDAQIRAHNLEILTRSAIACRFFKQYNIVPLYADTPQDTTIISDSNNYLKRWTVNLHLNFTNSITVSQEGFTDLKPILPNSIAANAEDVGLHFADVDIKFKS